MKNDFILCSVNPNVRLFRYRRGCRHLCGTRFSLEPLGEMTGIERRELEDGLASGLVSGWRDNRHEKTPAIGGIAEVKRLPV